MTSDEQAAAAFLAVAFEQGHEGVMAKSLDSRYAAGNRGADWLKIKQAHSLDLVILAAEWGSGRRAQAIDEQRALLQATARAGDVL